MISPYLSESEHGRHENRGQITLRLARINSINCLTIPRSNFGQLDIEKLMPERNIEVRQEAIRPLSKKFGPQFSQLLRVMY